MSEALLLELIHHTRDRLDSIRKLTRNPREFTECSSRAVDLNIQETDSIINSVMNYLKVSTPIEKTGTVNGLIEETLGKHHDLLARKSIRIIKRLQKDLPEATVPDEPLKYILDSLVQFAWTSLPAFSTLGFITRASGDGGHIEIFFLLAADIQMDQIPVSELGFLLVRETVLRHRGEMKVETTEKKSRTRMTLTFPVERRRVTCYSAPRNHPEGP